MQQTGPDITSAGVSRAVLRVAVAGQWVIGGAVYGSWLLSGDEQLRMALLILAVFGTYASAAPFIRDCSRRADVHGLPRGLWYWAFVAVVPIGATAYLLCIGKISAAQRRMGG